MSEKVARIARRTITDAARVASFETAKAIAPDLKTALQNEQITRGRVQDLEIRLGGLADCVFALERRAKVFDHMSPWSKLKWLLRGPQA